MNITDRFAGKSMWRIRLLFILLAGTIVRLALWARPIDTLATSVIIDDGFYYFKIAQNIVAGRGSTFDGINQIRIRQSDPLRPYHATYMVTWESK